MHGGVCYDEIESYRCECPPGYEGKSVLKIVVPTLIVVTERRFSLINSTVKR